ncbi:MAG: fatty acid desaturase family protein [Planctomycetia bacterium]
MTTAESSLPVQKARRLVADLLVPRPAIYWADFLASLCVGYGGALVYLESPPFSVVQLVAWVVAGLALFRLSLFMHEIVHFRRGEMTAFKVAWNVLAGIPMLTPSFLYEHHLDHHNARHYGTPRDGEYLPLGVARLRTLLGFVAEIAILPALAVLRFLVGTPMSFLHPRLRQFVLERCSPLVINLRCRREIPADAPRGLWAAMEWACFARACGFLTFLVTSHLHVGGHALAMTWHRPAKLYLLAMLALGLNHLRTLVAHRYTSAGERMSFAEQIDDSVNVEGRTPLVALMFPVGLRYHALHHLFPSIPYHNLGLAHRRIRAALPEWDAYRQATYTTFGGALRDLLASARAAREARPVPADRWFALRRAALASWHATHAALPMSAGSAGAGDRQADPASGPETPDSRPPARRAG